MKLLLRQSAASAAAGTAARRSGGHIERLRPNLSGLLVALAAGAVAIGASGCWQAALQLAPVAIAGVEDASQVAEDAIIGAHQGSERCESLGLDFPGVIELRKSAAGAPEYRQLTLRGSLRHAQWTPIIDAGAGTGGWRPAVNFPRMNFKPPLNNDAFPDAGSDYLAYAPAESISAVEEDRIAVLNMNSPGAVGTFNWEGKVYQYARTHTLPCFPPPP